MLALNEAARSYVHNSKQWTPSEVAVIPPCMLSHTCVTCCFDRSGRYTKMRIGRGNARGISADGAEL